MSQIQTKIGGKIATLIATADTVAERFILPSGALCTAGAKAIGISQDEVSEDEPMPVQIDGVAWVQVGAAVTQDAQVKSDGNGRAIVIASASDVVNGVALDEATLALQRIRVKIL